MVRPTVFPVVFCLASTATAVAAIPVHIKVELCTQNGKASPDEALVRLTPIGFIGSSPSERTISVRNGSADLTLPPAVWRAALNAPGLWAPVQDVVVQESGEDALATICVRRMGRLAGSASGAEGEGSPDIRAVLTSAPDEPAASPSGRLAQEVFSCSAALKEWSCDVPSGRFDVEIRVAGFVPQYHWGLPIAPDGVLRLPAIPLRRAASVSGEVHQGNGTPAERVPVALAPPGSSQPLGASEATQPAVSAVTNARGFFQLVGMPPGRYQVLAQGRAGVDAVVDVAVELNTESRLKTPLVLAAPAALTLHVNPETSPGGGRWSITLRRTELSTARAVAEAPVDSRGEWKRSNLRPGPYRLELSDRTGRWLVKTIEIESGDHRVEVDAQARRVRGSVRLGSSPVEGRIVWGGQFGPVRLSLPLDEDGRFEGIIPERPAEDAQWTVFVDGTRPAVARNVENVVLPSDPEQDVEIVLPGTSLRGTLVDEAGRPVPLAVVYVSRKEKAPLEQKKVHNEKGEFQFDGLAPGSYDVSAEAPVNLKSNEVPVTLEEEGNEASVRLVLRRTTDVTLRVQSPEGTPVPGARLYVLPAQSPDAGAPIEVSDLKGEVTVPLPNGTVEVLVGVGAAGYASRMSRVALSPEGVTVLELSRQGGTLRLTFAAALQDDALPLLYHGGMALAVPALTSSTLVSGGGPSSDSLSWTLPMLEPGRYTACVVAPASGAWTSDRSLRLGRAEGAPCAAGLLEPGSDLVLEQPR